MTLLNPIIYKTEPFCRLVSAAWCLIIIFVIWLISPFIIIIVYSFVHSLHVSLALIFFFVMCSDKFSPGKKIPIFFLSANRLLLFGGHIYITAFCQSVVGHVFESPRSYNNYCYYHRYHYFWRWRASKIFVAWKEV